MASPSVIAVGEKSPGRSNMSGFVTFFTPRTRYAVVILIVALVASLAVAAFRVRTESHARRVELAMDYTDLYALARANDYNPAAFLIALRRAGLTSLALTEELGANVGDNGKAYATTGAALVNQARLAPIADPALAALVRTHRIDDGAIYLIVSDAASYHRYLTSLALHFTPNSVRVLRGRRPWLLEVRTQIDYFNALGLGIADRSDRAGAPAGAPGRTSLSERRTLQSAADRRDLRRRAALRPEGLDHHFLRPRQRRRGLSRSPRRYRRRLRSPHL